MSNPAPGYAKHPGHRVAVTPSARRVQVRLGDVLIADSSAALLVEESRHDPVWYFPPDDVDVRLLVATDTTTYCPFKGHASYWSIDSGSAALRDAVWSYLTPYDECRALAGYYAFYADKVDLQVDLQVDGADAIRQ